MSQDHDDLQSNSNSTHLAITLHPPSHNVRVERVPLPVIQDPDDAVLRVDLAGLCGSDLHFYRGNIPFDQPFVMGHEVYGTILRLGTSFTHTSENVNPHQIQLGSTGALKGWAAPRGYLDLNIGDRVVSTFSTSCMECTMCLRGFTARCSTSKLLGTTTLPGAQAQYIRIPNAGGSLIPAVSFPCPLQALSAEDKLRKESLTLLLADILPTGYFAAKQAWEHPNLSDILKQIRDCPDEPRIQLAIHFAILGLGPVGLCAAISLIHLALESDYFPASIAIYAVDPLENRRSQFLKMAEAIARERWEITISGKGRLAEEELANEGRVNIRIHCRSLEEMKGEAMHAVLEVVGSNDALQLAYELIRPFGVISSVGAHTSSTFPIPPSSLYNKNVSLAFGRCPVRAFIEPASTILQKYHDVFSVCGFIDKIVPIQDEVAVKEAYRAFDQGEVGKVVFAPWT